MLLDHLSITITSRFCTKASFTFWKKVMRWHSSSWAYDTVQSPRDCRVFKFRQLSWHELLCFMILCHRPPCDTTQGVLMIRKRKMPKVFHPVLGSLWLSTEVQIVCQLSPQFLRAHLYGSVPAMSEDFAPKAYFLFFFREHLETASPRSLLLCCKSHGINAWHWDWSILGLLCVRYMQNPFWENEVQCHLLSPP